jgi:hypothetical protein
MKEDDVRKRAFAMPLTSPAYPPGPYRFLQREYLIITSRDRSGHSGFLPRPQGRLHALQRRGDDRRGHWSIQISCVMFLNDGPPIAGGRELWGFPKKLAQPSLRADGLIDFQRLGHRDRHTDRHTRLWPRARCYRHHGLQIQGGRPSGGKSLA